METKLWLLALQGLLETLYMVGVSGLVAFVLGLPLGTALYLTRREGLFERPKLHRPLSVLVNASRSLPFVILMIALIPLTRWCVGSSIGVHAALVPLSLGAVPFVARLVESAFLEIPSGVIDMIVSLGASPKQIVLRVLIPEALPALVQSVTLSLVSLVGYSAMAGTMGGGGLGDLAIRYGYQRFNTPMMVLTVALLIALVHAIQFAGDTISKKVNKKGRVSQ